MYGALVGDGRRPTAGVAPDRGMAQLRADHDCVERAVARRRALTRPVALLPLSPCARCGPAAPGLGRRLGPDVDLVDGPRSRRAARLPPGLWRTGTLGTPSAASAPRSGHAHDAGPGVLVELGGSRDSRP